MTPESAQLLARYNRWMNRRLYAACAALPDAERKRDTGTFFRSMHGILNHILLADRGWMGRFTGNPIVIRSLDEELYADFDDLRAARREMDAAIIAWTAGLTPAALAGTLRFVPSTSPEPRELPLWIAVTHLFNHQTHHRGQLATLLFQAGGDTGVTDIPWMPGVLAPPEEEPEEGEA